jgi:chromosome partitioning protein
MQTTKTPRVIAVVNEKGGVGKSALVAHLAFYAAELGQRVLVVDTDSAGGQAALFGIDKQGVVGASALFAGEAEAQALKCSEAIYLIPADDAMVDVDRVGLQLEDGGTLPKEAVSFRKNLMEAAAGYDLVLIDTPGALQDRVLCVMFAADAIFTPFSIEAQTSSYLGRVGATYQTVRAKFKPELKHLGLVASMIECRSKSEMAALAELREQAGSLMVPGAVCRRAHIKNSMREGRAVWVKARSKSDKHAAAEMKAVCAELLNRAAN